MDEYSEHKCSCGEELFQHSGDWYCPDCDDISTFKLQPQRDSFEL